MNLGQFQEYCRNAFRFLIDGYGFHEIPRPEEKFANEYMVCFSNETTLVCIEGVNWGYGIAVWLASHDAAQMRYRAYNFQDLIEIRSPGFPLPEAKLDDSCEIQKIQMDWYAAALKTHAKDILRGDFTIFPRLADAITSRGGQPDSNKKG